MQYFINEICDVLIDASLKSLVVFCLAIVVLGLIRGLNRGQANVHAAHRIWMFVVISMLTLPLLSILIPHWAVPMNVKWQPEPNLAEVSILPADEIFKERELFEPSINVETNRQREGTEFASSSDPEAVSLDRRSELKLVASSQVKLVNDSNSLIAPPITALESENYSFIQFVPLVVVCVWAVGLCVCIMKLLIAIVKTRNVILGATVIQLPETSLSSNSNSFSLPARTSVLETGAISSPVVSGLFSYQIMLPEQWRAWSTEKLTAVLAHESAHIGRRDGLVSFLAELSTILYWFNPIAWIAKVKLSRLAELSCDQTAALDTGDRLNYARQLIEIAAANSNGRFQPGIAMATRTQLMDRIESLLDTGRPLTRQVSRIFLVAMVLFGVPTLLLVASAQPSSEHTNEPTQAAKAQESFPPTVRREANTTWEINGLVRSPSGIPVPIATYRVESGTTYRPMWRSYSRLINEGQVSALGTFNISVSTSNFVVAIAPGYAPTAVGVPEGSFLEIDLDSGRSVSGTVRLPDGKPAENAIVRPVAFLGTLSKFQLSVYPVSEVAIHPQLRYRSLGFPESGEPWTVRTDADGRFTLDRVPSNCPVAVAIELAGYQTQAVWVKAPDDNNENFRPQFELKSDDFEISLKPSFVLKLSGRNLATGNLEKISRILVQPSFVQPQDVSLSNRQVYAIDYEPSVEVTASLLPMADGADFWIEPENDALMGARIHVDHIGAEGEVEMVIPFRPGKILKGAVTSVVDGGPIQGANLVWIGPDRNKWTAEGDFPQITVQTDEDGSFAIAVPESDGSLAIIGSVDGFRTVDSWKWIVDPLTGDPNKEFLQEFTRGVLDAGGPINFELEPASEIRFHVVRPNGQAEQQAIIAATIDNAASETGGPPYSSYRRDTLSADAEGNATLANWYSHAGWLAQARGFLGDPNDRTKLRTLEELNSAGYPTTVEAFSSLGMRQGSAVIPLPELGSWDPIDVEIKLTESATILGYVIDQDGQPMDDLKISLARSVNSLSYGSQIWETRTRNDGYFLATGLLPGNDYLIQLGNRDVKPLGAMLDRLLLNIKDELLPGTTTEIETIECLDCRFLGGDLSELNIEGLEQPEAFEVIENYVQQLLAKIPEENPRFPSESTADPIPVFLEKLETVLVPKLKEASNLDPGSDVELEQLTVIGSLFLPPSLSSSFSGGERIRYFVSERLLEQFNEHPIAQPTLLVIAESLAINESPVPWKDLFDRSNYTPTKQKAGIEAALRLAQEVGNETQTRRSTDQFEAKFLALENHLNEMEELPGPQTNTEVDALQSRVDGLRNEFQSRYEFNENHDVPETYRYNPDLLQILFDRMDLFVEHVRT